jgi:hypothetical protein
LRYHGATRRQTTRLATEVPSTRRVANAMINVSPRMKKLGSKVRPTSPATIGRMMHAARDVSGT